MPDMSAYTARSTVVGTDRLFIASATSDVIQVATAAQIAALASSGTGTSGTSGGGSSAGNGPLYAPGWGSFRSTGAWNRPALSSLTMLNWTGNGPIGTGGASVSALDIPGGPIHFYADLVESWLALGVNPGANPWTSTFLLTMEGRADLANSLGVLVANATTGNFITAYTQCSASPPPFYVDRWNNLSGGGSRVTNQYNRSQLFSQALMALRIKFDGTNISFSAANDPLSDASFVPLYTEAASAFLGTPNFVGFGFYAPAGTDNATVNCWGMTVTTP